MKKLLLSLLFISPFMAAAEIPLIIDEIDGLAAPKTTEKQAHVLELCQTQDNEHCRMIISILENVKQWPTMPWYKKVWNYKKMPMPQDLTRAILRAQATALGNEHMWSEKRISDEIGILYDEYEKTSAQ